MEILGFVHDESGFRLSVELLSQDCQVVSVKLWKSVEAIV
jgi:hypothetical protein